MGLIKGNRPYTLVIIPVVESPIPQMGVLTWISRRVWMLLAGCRKGGASAPPKSRLQPSVGPAPRAVPQARDTGIIRKAL
jgi:hypothetical protein